MIEFEPKKEWGDLSLIFNYQYEFDNDSRRIYITGLPFTTKYVEVPREKRFERLYSYGLIKMDLVNALRYLEISLQTDNLIVKEGMFRIALVLYIKCFNNSSGGRPQLPLNKVYQGIPGEPIECYNKLKKIRDKYIAHDVDDFLSAKLGMVLNENAKSILGIAYPEVQAKFDYDETLKILLSLCKIALEKATEYFNNEVHNVEDYLKQHINYDIARKYPDMTIDINEI